MYFHSFNLFNINLGHNFEYLGLCRLSNTFLFHVYLHGITPSRRYHMVRKHITATFFLSLLFVSSECLRILNKNPLIPLLFEKNEMSLNNAHKYAVLNHLFIFLILLLLFGHESKHATWSTTSLCFLEKTCVGFLNIFNEEVCADEIMSSIRFVEFKACIYELRSMDLFLVDCFIYCLQE
jgi:hypothetical protein